MSTEEQQKAIAAITPKINQELAAFENYLRAAMPSQGTDTIAANGNVNAVINLRSAISNAEDDYKIAPDDPMRMAITHDIFTQAINNVHHSLRDGNTLMAEAEHPTSASHTQTHISMPQMLVKR